MRILAVIMLWLIPCSLYSQKIIGIIGSSTAAGNGPDSRDSAWAWRVVKYYNTNGITTSQYNVALSGMDCYQGMPTGYIPPPGRNTPIPDHNITQVMTGNPDVVIVSYPTNSYNVLSVREVLFCLDTIRHIALAAGKPCFVATTQPRSDFTQAIRDTLRVLRDSILNRFGAYAIDFYTGLDSANGMLLSAYDAGNGYHINSAGHAILARRVLSANILAIPLPVRLLDFSLTTESSAVDLLWAATDETTQSAYEVERSADGVIFLPVAEVHGHGGLTKEVYTFRDPHPAEGTNYYRLRIMDGQSAFYSVIKTVTIVPHILELSKCYPVPVSDILHLELMIKDEQTVEFDIMNESGIIVYRYSQILHGPRCSISIPTASLSTGTYYLRLQAQGATPVNRAFMKK